MALCFHGPESTRLGSPGAALAQSHIHSRAFLQGLEPLTAGMDVARDRMLTKMVSAMCASALSTADSPPLIMPSSRSAAFASARRIASGVFSGAVPARQPQPFGRCLTLDHPLLAPP